MKFRDEFRDPDAARRYAEAIARAARQPWTLMEVCGGQTHAIVRFGIDQLLPENLSLVHGPGCPVCVTPVEYIDKAIEIACRAGVVFCSFGDMLRVPGSDSSLLAARTQGADLRIVQSPLDALRIAREEPGSEVVFFAVGFETTAPANALAIHLAKTEGIGNFSALVSHVLVPPAMRAILSAPDNRIQAFLAAGHVCAIMGCEAYEPLAREFGVPIVVTGFEPVDILQGILMCVDQLEAGEARVENQYSRVVRPSGNASAQDLIRDVFQIIPRNWRGIGEIAGSGLGLRAAYGAFDAERRFGPVGKGGERTGPCISGLVLQGARKPFECPAFGKACTPEHPLGVTMVSGEGACAAYYRYRNEAAGKRAAE
jgi:hydrogenase expression/formation protein HypD